MTWVLLGVNAILAVSLLAFIVEARGEWQRARDSAERAEERLRDLEAMTAAHEVRLGSYFRQLRGMQQEIGWSDDRAWTRVLVPPKQ